MPTLITPVKEGPIRRAPWASDTARSYALKLLRERDHESLTGATLQTALDLVAGAKVYSRACSRLIDALKALPFASNTLGQPQVTEGVYVLDGAYVRVQRSRERHSLYAMQWSGGIWVYISGLISRITPEMAATADQAKAFGDRFHRCVYCSTELTDDRSITAGYGPTCAENYGLPWGNK